MDILTARIQLMDILAAEVYCRDVVQGELCVPQINFPYNLNATFLFVLLRFEQGVTRENLVPVLSIVCRQACIVYRGLFLKFLPGRGLCLLQSSPVCNLSLELGQGIVVHCLR